MALHHVRPGEKIRLSRVGPSADAKTSALVKTDAFEAVQLVLRAGEEISGHSVPGYASFHCLEGRVNLNLPEELQLAAGDWVYLDRRQQYSLVALEDSSLLLTILFDSR